MKQAITLSPPNSLILVMDYKAGVVPDTIGSGLLAATESCLAIGTLSADDGETSVTLTNEWKELPEAELVFEGQLATPNLELAICNVWNEKLIALPVLKASVKVRVFANDFSEPDKIIIFVE